MWVEVPLFFALGLYGGFIQAGIGIFLLAALVLGAGFNLVAANGVKNLIVLIVTAAALAVFVVNGQVHGRWVCCSDSAKRPVPGSRRAWPSGAARNSCAGS